MGTLLHFVAYTGKFNASVTRNGKNSHDGRLILKTLYTEDRAQKTREWIRKIRGRERSKEKKKKPAQSALFEDLIT